MRPQLSESRLHSFLDVRKSDRGGVQVFVDAVRDCLVRVVTTDGVGYSGFVSLDGDFLVLSQRIPLGKVLSVSTLDSVGVV